MLPAHIIDSIREREAKRQEEREQPVLEMPRHYQAPRPYSSVEVEKGERGVTVIDL